MSDFFGVRTFQAISTNEVLSNAFKKVETLDETITDLSNQQELIRELRELPENDRLYPPAPLLDNTETLTGLPYGNGEYIASSSSVVSSSFPPHRAFDHLIVGGAGGTDGLGWQSSNNLYDDTTGFYTGSQSITDINGNKTFGEWLRIELPTKIILDRYVIYPIHFESLFDRRFPRSFKIYGSNDNINFTEIENRVNVDWVRDATDTTRSQQSFEITGNKKPFKIYTLLTTEVGVFNETTSSRLIAIVEWELFEKVVSVFSKDEILNLGNKLPTSDPNIEGALFNDGGTLKISSG